MDVSEAVERRMSVRAYLPDVPPKSTVRRIVEKALRAPSGGNLQPWRVYALAGEPLARLLDDVAAAIASGARQAPEYAVYPENLWEPFRTRRFENGEDLYASLGIAREDKARRLQQFLSNYRLFGAPVGLFFCLDRRVGPPQWSDLGMFMQTVMLLAVEEGLDTCAQEAWSRFPQTVARHLELPDHEMLFSGMALGFRDEAHPINQWRSDRASLDEVAAFRGF